MQIKTDVLTIKEPKSSTTLKYNRGVIYKSGSSKTIFDTRYTGVLQTEIHLKSSIVHLTGLMKWGILKTVTSVQQVLAYPREAVDLTDAPILQWRPYNTFI